ncbi:MAG: carboxypeptidase M32 [Opitutaceae bacterium]
MKAPTYNQLVSKLQRINCLESVVSTMSWDEQVNLPPASSDRRGAQMALLAELHHREAADPVIGDWLAQLESGSAGSLDEGEQAVVREARRQFDRIARLPAEFVARKAVLDTEAFHAWELAKRRSDFPAYRPFLEQQLALAKEEAGYHGFEGSAAYDFHIDSHDPGMTASRIDPLFRELRTGLLPLVEEILASPVKADASALEGLSVEGQRLFLREVTGRIGFDYHRGRIDTSSHPFCGGDAADTRMTTRFVAGEPLEALFSSIHETGHALYEQGLPIQHLGTALGTAVGMAIHESQSRLWENQVGRGKAFWRFFEPRFREIFGLSTDRISSGQLLLAANAVRIHPIRTESDEVTYNLHIMLRFELEKRLFDGDLEVRDLPEAWNSLSSEILGLRPANDAEGVLQDVHWSGGDFGYFPSYCLGNMIAAQLWETVRSELPDLDSGFEQGDFSALLNWLRERIHRQGQRFGTDELVRRVTGHEISPKPLLCYLEERYLPLYRPT